MGGTLDTTGSVVAASALVSERAMRIGTIVKFSQNVLIGVAAFILSVWWALGANGGNKAPNAQRPGARVIWDRFPKFVLGFILISILASVGLFSKAQLADLTALRNWAFTLAFISIGLELSFGELKRTGARPLVAYLIATVFNTLLALGVAAVIFGGIAGF
jgi:uncharacterized membrane protein YadS